MQSEHQVLEEEQEVPVAIADKNLRRILYSDGEAHQHEELGWYSYDREEFFVIFSNVCFLVVVGLGLSADDFKESLALFLVSALCWMVYPFIQIQIKMKSFGA